jgi:hypothetical protein
MDNDEKMGEGGDGAGAGGGSSTRQGGDKLTAMLLGSDVELYTTVEQVQGIIQALEAAVAGGKVDAGRAFTRMVALNKHKDELQQVKRGRDETESGNPAHKGDNQRTN